MTNLYNENDPYVAQWLRNLIAAGHIAPGVVDERSIVDLDPDELRRYTQCHFFAGIGVWSHALRLAGWPDDRPVWTGSCPCQPFSAAGKRGGHEDERHLWPAWRRLIRECKPAAVYGEQVASPDGLAWLDVVLSDLEDDHYAVAAANLCAAGVGAPHIRQRLYFVAHAACVGQRWEARELGGLRPAGRLQAGLVAHDDGAGRHRIGAARLHERRAGEGGEAAAEGRPYGALGHDADGCGEAGLVADTDGRNASAEGLQRSGEYGLLAPGSGPDVAHADDPGSQGRRGAERARLGADGQAAACGATGAAGKLADPEGGRLGQGGAHASGRDEGTGPQGAGLGSADDRGRSVADAELHDGTGRLAQSHGRPPVESDRHGAAGFWSDADWIACRDGKARPVEPGTFPLAHGAAARVGRLRAYGNAIVPQVAAAFIEASEGAMT